MIEKIVIIGAGNLATQLALTLTEKGIRIQQIFSRKIEKAKELAEKTKSDFTNNLSDLTSEADLYLIVVKDSAIQEVLENLKINENCLIVHTAGSVPMDVLSDFTNNYGVFYPLQSFSKSRKIDFSTVPLCIEANHPSNLIKLQNLAETLSSSVHQINSEERKTLHLAAVFVNNFVNHFYVIGAEILKDKKLDFDLLRPLIFETVKKIEIMHPIDAQTGPAKRYDRNIIDDHLKMLQDKPEFQKIYSFVTESIYRVHQKHEHGLL
jgi:predicted short-subunit dehydrogenase-like oxidoreductase (DUF2520 family)